MAAQGGCGKDQGTLSEGDRCCAGAFGKDEAIKADILVPTYPRLGCGLS